MRPGPIGPGNLKVRSFLGTDLNCFNEARPNWAGKFKKRLAEENQKQGFNEARPNWAGK